MFPMGVLANSKSSLSTFRAENLKIALPKGCSNIFEEAFILMKSYFINRNKIEANEWEAIRMQYSKMEVPNHPTSTGFDVILNSFSGP